MQLRKLRYLFIIEKKTYLLFPVVCVVRRMCVACELKLPLNHITRLLFIFPFNIVNKLFIYWIRWFWALTFVTIYTVHYIGISQLLSSTRTYAIHVNKNSARTDTKARTTRDRCDGGAVFIDIFMDGCNNTDFGNISNQQAATTVRRCRGWKKRVSEALFSLFALCIRLD